MFLRLLVLTCIFYSVCCAENTQETMTFAKNETNKSEVGESMILTTTMIVSMSCVLMVLIPTALYYRCCSQEAVTEPWPMEIH